MVRGILIVDLGWFTFILMLSIIHFRTPHSRWDYKILTAHGHRIEPLI